MDVGRIQEHRNGETGLLPFRTRRVFNIGTEWFFAVRGEKDHGPYENELVAQNKLTLFLNKFNSELLH